LLTPPTPLRTFLPLLKIPVDPGVSIEDLAARTVRFSGADIHLLCREASMMPMRRLLAGKTPDDILRMRNEGALQAPPVTMADFNAAVQRTNPSVSDADITKFAAWEREFGST
jgi:katanin p60 ATPase-containing subunit A1|tara:strand:+ start:1579 stop:1917 length:339 start_codon:yes stop_codon:yes gene_type:complete